MLPEAAITTGAIEGLYEADRGVTATIAQASSVLSAEVAQKKEDMESYYKSQLNVYEQLNLQTDNVPITEAYIRNLHDEICSPQKEYKAYINVDNNKQTIYKELIHGQYKEAPNHVILNDGSIHSDAPVHETAKEMQRLVEEIASDEFVNASGVYQASYVHYALVCIHPFSDGNGRVARALASIYTYKAYKVPFLVYVEDQSYFSALSEADNGKFESFIQFTSKILNQAIKLVIELFRVSSQKSIEDQISELDAVYITKGNYTHSQVDSAGYELMTEIYNAFEQKINSYSSISDNISFNLEKKDASYEVSIKTMRPPISTGGKLISLLGATAAPASVRLIIQFVVEVPKSGGENDFILIRETKNDNNNFEAELSEAIPIITTGLSQRIDLYTERIINYVIARLVQSAKNKLKADGY